MKRARTATTLIAATGLASIGALALATSSSAFSFGSFADLPTANPKTPGYAAPNLLASGLADTIAAQGSMKLENGTSAIPYYGYLGNGPLVPLPGTTAEASKTEPDKNTYLVLKDQHGADPRYNYGTHFLYQGHETGAGYLTRVNLDADGAHRVTLLASTDATGAPLPTFDGSTWDPWAKRLLFTTENGKAPAVYQATPDLPGNKVEVLAGEFGGGGYEAIQNDSDGNLWLVEDVGGTAGTANPNAKQPNSFVYRFVPVDKTDLTKGGKLQALQILNPADGTPFTFHDGQADADITGTEMQAIHTYGTSLATKWVTVHDTAIDGFATFNATSLAKSAGASPFKRPENGQFQPGTKFQDFFFDETGDTNALTEAGAALGGFGSVLHLHQDSPSASTGTLSLFYLSDLAHSGFDNVTFLDARHVTFVEDAGDKLHTQRNALDSAYVFDVKADYSHGKQPSRLLAEGRDASATIDSGLLGTSGFQNEGDNEITGMHESDGDPSDGGILGAKYPQGLSHGWRLFWTAQHGDNVTFEITPG